MAHRNINVLFFAASIIVAFLVNSLQVSAQGGVSNHISFNLNPFVNGIYGMTFVQHGDELKVDGTVSIVNGTQNEISVKISVIVDGQVQSVWGPATLPGNSTMNPAITGVKIANADSHVISVHVEVRDSKGALIGTGVDAYGFNRIIPGDPEIEPL